MQQKSIPYDFLQFCQQSIRISNYQHIESSYAHITVFIYLLIIPNRALSTHKKKNGWNNETRNKTEDGKHAQLDKL